MEKIILILMLCLGACGKFDTPKSSISSATIPVVIPLSGVRNTNNSCDHEGTGANSIDLEVSIVDGTRILYRDESAVINQAGRATMTLNHYWQDISYTTYGKSIIDFQIAGRTIIAKYLSDINTSLLHNPCNPYNEINDLSGNARF
jgi:hypothetical protein